MWYGSVDVVTCWFMLWLVAWCNLVQCSATLHRACGVIVFSGVVIMVDLVEMRAYKSGMNSGKLLLTYLIICCRQCCDVAFLSGQQAQTSSGSGIWS